MINNDELKNAVKHYNDINARGRVSGAYANIMINAETGHVWVDEYASRSSWTQYTDAAVFNLGAAIQRDEKPVNCRTARQYAAAIMAEYATRQK